MERLNRPKVEAVVVLAVGLLCANGRPAQAANCSLRNPDRQIYQFFPQATSYRSVVQHIGKKERRKIEAQLGSALGYNELGKHTFYVVLKDAVPLGFVHARSEIGQRGLIELVWAFDLNLRIIGFQTQRCRDRHSDAIKSPTFRQHFLGKGPEELRELLSDGNSRLNEAIIKVPQKAEALCYIVTLSAVKTAFVTQNVFGKVVRTAQILGYADRFYPGAAKTLLINEPYDDDAAQRIRRVLHAGEPLVRQEGFSAAWAQRVDGTRMGLVVRCVWTGQPPATVWWALSPDGRIEKVLLVDSVDDSVLESFTGLEGRRLEDLIRPDSAAVHSGGAPGPKRGALTADDPARQCALETLAVLQGLFSTGESRG